MNKKTAFQIGIKDAIPIALGYLAVAFSLGISAKNAGLNSIQGFFISATCNASAGEYVAFTVIAAHAAYIEMVIATIITNARYFLMSASLAQRLDANTSLGHRLLLAYGITDELFGIGIAKIQSHGPFYMYGAYLISLSFWAFGTMFGVIAGEILPAKIVTALGVALYGMFLAIVIPAAKKDHVIKGVVILCFILSWSWEQFLPHVDSSTKTIVLTLIVSTLAAIFFPRKEEKL